MTIANSLTIAAAGAAVGAAILGGLPSPGFAADVTPTPTPSQAAVTVVIPDTSSPAPNPSSSGGSSSGGSSSGGSGGNSSGGATTPAADLPTEAFAAPIPLAQPTANAPGLKLDHETISVTQWMIAIGAGYTPGENVQFVFYPGAIVIGSFVADASGSVTARFRIPKDMRLGQHVVEATGWTSKHVANKEFTVVSLAVAGGIPFLWWIIVVLGVLLVGLISMSIYFRHSIARWFGGGLQPSGSIL